MARARPQAHDVQRLPCALRPVPRAHPADSQRQLHILKRRQQRQQPERLEYEPNPVAAQLSEFLLAHPRQILLLEQHLPAARLVQARHNVQQRRLARSRPAHHRDELPREHIQVHPPQRVDLLRTEVVCAEHVHRGEKSLDSAQLDCSSGILGGIWNGGGAIKPARNL